MHKQVGRCEFGETGTLDPFTYDFCSSRLQGGSRIWSFVVYLKFVMPRAFAALTTCLLTTTALSAVAQAENDTRVNTRMSLPAVTVYAPRMSMPAQTDIDLHTTPPRAPHSDGGSFLRSAPGVTAGRFGGHGLEPVIRGQSQNQLNIIANGASTYGGCPNRMDPPTSYAAIESFDRIKIVRGYQSVLNGPGGPGGSVILSHDRPKVGETISMRGVLSAGYDANGVTRFVDGYGVAVMKEGYVRATGSAKDAENYEDGNGNSVRSSYSERQNGFTFGLTPGDSTHIRAGYNNHEVEDGLFPGAGMDSPMAETDTYTAGLEHSFNTGVIRRIDVSGYASLVDHVMDNFSLRARAAGPFLRVDSESDTIGGAFKTDFNIGGQLVETAIDYRRNKRDATRLVGGSAATVSRVQSVMWPDLTIRELGFAAETTFDISDSTAVVAGARYDRVKATYGRADERAAMTGRTPNDLYRAFYGVTAGDRTENNLGGLLRLEYGLGDVTTLFGSVSRTVRTADATERGLVNDRGLGANNASWIGNPDIDPENHHQLEAGLTTGGADWQINASAYVNMVDNYILRDSARGLNGILITSANADVYRNIDALLAGIELNGEWAVTDTLRAKADTSVTYGEDRDADRALPQIPPLQGAVHLDWQAEEYLQLGGTVRYATRQSRVDTNTVSGTGRDVSKTAGYAVMDLRTVVTPATGFEVSAGVTNVFDTSYANHLNRSNSFDPVEVRVNEPGRSVFVRGRVTF